MTNEESIKRIQDFIGWFKKDSDIYEALEMAIQALSQEPTEKPITVDEMEREYEKSKALFHKIVECEDTISRQAVKELIKSGVSTDTYDDVEQVCKWIDALPSVTQKSGKWILTIEDWNKWTCSKCGYVKRTDIHVNIGWKYCPNCGARMDEPQESEE